MWRPSHLCSAGERWDAGPRKWPSTFFWFKRIDVGLQEQYALRRKEHAYLSCTYTKISLTRNETSVFLCFVCLGLQVWLKRWLMSVYALIVKQTKWLKCYSVLLHWCNEMDDFFFLIFTSEIKNHCPETGQCGLLMYNNEMCSIVVFWSWFMIGFNCKSPISETLMFAAVPFVVLFEAEIHFGVLTGQSATVNLLAWSKVFYVSVLSLLSIWNVLGVPTPMDWNCHVDNQSDSLFTCLFGL